MQILVAVATSHLTSLIPDEGEDSALTLIGRGLDGPEGCERVSAADSSGRARKGRETMFLLQ